MRNILIVFEGHALIIEAVSQKGDKLLQSRFLEKSRKVIWRKFELLITYFFLIKDNELLPMAFTTSLA